MDAHITKHAEIRMQQRGVSIEVLDLLLRYGRRTRAGKGAEIVFFDKSARARVLSMPGGESIRRDTKQLKSYAVCKGDTILTTGKLYKRVRR